MGRVGGDDKELRACQCLVGRSAWSAGGRFLEGSARGSGCGDGRWYSQSYVNGEFGRPGRLAWVHKDWQPNVPRIWDMKSIRMRLMCMARGGRRWCAAHGPMTRGVGTLRNTTFRVPDLGMSRAIRATSYSGIPNGPRETEAVSSVCIYWSSTYRKPLDSKPTFCTSVWYVDTHRQGLQTHSAREWPAEG